MNSNTGTQTSVMVHMFLLLSIHKVVRPADADKITNLAQHPKSLGTAGLEPEPEI